MTLTEEERQIIRLYAGSSAKRDEAIEIYQCHIAEHVKSDRYKCPEMEFMSEIVLPCSDLAYRAMLRQRLLKAL